MRDLWHQRVHYKTRGPRCPGHNERPPTAAGEHPPLLVPGSDQPVLVKRHQPPDGQVFVATTDQPDVDYVKSPDAPQLQFITDNPCFIYF